MSLIRCGSYQRAGELTGGNCGGEKTTMWTLFEYRYRDAGNFKAFGCVALDGRIDKGERDAIRGKLDCGEYFIAEQVGLPPLYEQLYKWSNGPIVSDHCWHEFVSFREVEALPDETQCVRNAGEFLARFTSMTDWDLSLSPHFDLAGLSEVEQVPSVA